MRSIEALLLLVDLLALIGLSVPRAGAMRVLLPDLEPDCDSASASASAPKPVLAGPALRKESGIRASDCLSEASSSSTPAFLAQHRLPVAKRRDPDCGSPFLLLTLLLAKQKKSE